MSSSQARYLSQSPNPEWTVGARLSDLSNESAREWQQAMDTVGFKSVDPGNMEAGALYKLLISGVVPRPIAFVSTVSTAGTGNLAPFSYFQLLSHSPPLCMISCTHITSTKLKDTCENILQTKEFTINIISDSWVEAANYAAIDAPPEIDEWEGSGLTRVESVSVRPPRVKESAFSLECTLRSSQQFAALTDPNQITTTLIIGDIRRLHVRSDVLNGKGDAVDPTKLHPVMRFGAATYGKVNEVYNIPRPKWEDSKSL